VERVRIRREAIRQDEKTEIDNEDRDYIDGDA
jgi:hypothetical protein